MTSRQRLLAVLDGQAPDHVPLTTWSFGFSAPPGGRWLSHGERVAHWYSLRLEHIHTLPCPWTVEDEVQRALAWRRFDVDDVLELSVPWGTDPAVRRLDTALAPGNAAGDPRYTVLVRQYDTPAGPLRHAVRRTERAPAGWPRQPDHVPLFEDFNIPRAVHHVVAGPADVPAIKHLYAAPGPGERQRFTTQAAALQAHPAAKDFLCQAWAAFGMDAVVWLAGTEGAVLLAMDEPTAFRQLVETIAATDYARAELAAATPGVDLVGMRGWYSSTDLWSPAVFERYVWPQVRELAALVHRHGRKFAYVMTTGVERLGPRLADAGVDVLYFVDPVQDRLKLERARELFGERLLMVGGTNSVSLVSGDLARVRNEVRRALDVLGPTHRFVLHPVDALLPDTPWAPVAALIEAWRDAQ